MNELMTFNNPEFGEIRTIEVDGEPWLVGKDVAQALGYSNPRKALDDHIDPEDKIQGDGVTIRDSMGREQHPTLINESGLYSLVLSSKLPGAKKFRRWVTAEVLPSIRKTGTYSTDTAKQSAADKRATAMLLNAKNRTASILQRLYDRAGTKPEYQAMALSDFYAKDGVHLPRMAFQDVKQTYDKGAIAEKLGVYSKASGGKTPHAQAIGAIIATLDLSEDERERLPYCNNGHDGVDYQYTESVVEKVWAWLEANNKPSPITVNGKNYAVIYRKDG